MDREYRLIHALHFELDPPAGSVSAQVVIWLGRDRMPLSETGNGLPRPPKTRTIDLRPGDQVRVDSLWRQALEVKAYGEAWLTAEQGAAKADRVGYLYRPRVTIAP